MNPVPTLHLCIFLTVAIASCLSFQGEETADEQGLVSDMPNGGSWQLEVRVENGPARRIGLHLHGSMDQTPDGSEHEMPLLDVWGPYGKEIQWVTRYLLDDSGIQGLAGLQGSQIVTGLVDPIYHVTTFMIEPFAYEENRAVIIDPGHLDPHENEQDYANRIPWFVMGPGIWGKPLDQHNSVSMDLNWPHWTGDEYRLVEVGLLAELVAVSNGCSQVSFTVDGRYQATSNFCERPLPQRVEVTYPYNMTIDITLMESGVEMPPYPSVRPGGDPSPIGKIPKDGSNLSLTLDQVHHTLLVDPRTHSWLEDHPDARALQGSFHVRPKLCVAEDIQYSCTNRVFLQQQQYAEKIVQWNLTWWTPEGKWMRAAVMKPDIPNVPPSVAEYETGASGYAPQSNLEESVPLAAILETWFEAAQDDYVFWGIEFDLEDGGTPWKIIGRMQAQEESPEQPWLRSHVVFDPSNGFLERGSRPMRYLEQYAP